MNLQNQHLFLQQFSKNFVDIGTLFPSSVYLAQASVAYLTEKKGPITVLEAGAGTGSLTKVILQLLKPDDSLDLIELNPELTSFLQQRLRHDPAFQHETNLRLINGNLLHFPLKRQYDFIVCSLPFSNFPPAMVNALMTKMMAQLKSGGVFSYIKYAGLKRLKYAFGTPDIRTSMKEKQTLINRFKRTYQIEQRLVWANFPPTWVYYWRK